MLNVLEAISKLETKASSYEGQCIPAGYCHAHNADIHVWS